MNFDLNVVPFSRRESFLAISILPEAQDRQQGLYLRTVRGGDDKFGEAFHMDMLDESGQSVSFQAIACPELIRLESTGGLKAEICISDHRTFRIRTKGCGIRLTFRTAAYDYAYQAASSSWEVNSFTHECRFMLTALVGDLRMEVPWDKIKSSYVIADFLPDRKSGISEFAVEEFHTVWEPRAAWESFDDAVKQAMEEFNQWLNRTLPLPERWHESRELAAYRNDESSLDKQWCITCRAYLKKTQAV
ncbi:MAG: hypothetical protein K0Q73_4662 [Paenibacillus sp.]|jgi:hypothetical protein|nr:hypothetical protein [Paenibacillus sp.]